MRATSAMFGRSRATGLVAALSLFASILVVASPVQAAEVDYTLQGRVTASSVPEIPFLAPVTVSYSIEDTTLDLNGDPTQGLYDRAITDLSVALNAGAALYTITGDPDATPSTLNRVDVSDMISGDSFNVQLGTPTAPDGTLTGSPSLVSGFEPLRFDLSGSDTDGLTLGDDSVDIAQSEFDRFAAMSNPSTTARVLISFVDRDGRPGFVETSVLFVVVSDGGQNAEPAADPGGPYLGAQGTVIDFDGSASSDPDGDSLTHDWDFGDGSTGIGEFPNHAYSNAGLYDVCLTVNDGTIDSTEACTSAVVYDPSAGFVTGGGWIDSPEGAYVADPTQSGKATFGFVSKYKKGASVPTGNTQFNFQAADLNFHSTSYQWLVVTGADSANFKGEGSLNGEDGYNFQLWASDGDPDTFRIKIWTGEDDVVYDNGSAQAISMGSIIVHTK